ncbi:hypothetical protein PHJA_001397100 [Phtheirospermum japonicum]|uniref:Zinc finger PHD-type domain-containing protein n=1 Tax=Phtheirospermum japonicum TaxID=374723 RepID=A0A830C0M3_9LAMI|nr:hypothetical protein PHJA_001397100 [Phtheirospermum japonicum]
MKSRSHRLPVSEPHHDDWVNGSWTVDCICGVNYDDGEEMVDCDECGVWVHTRCSRYVKSEKSFACDKCKSKNSGGSGVGNDSEETEVAEFLVELPTKTLGMDNPNSASAAPPRRPFRLWTDIPMEDRVHVQGVPGGEPGLLSGVFGPELWKATGYVPKKFNFRYSEFPCLGDEEKKEKELVRTSSGGENGNRDDNGAGVLFSLLKENDNTGPTPVVDSVGVKGPVEGSGCHELLSRKQKKDPIVLHSGKRKKEGLRMSKDQNTKKKVRTVEEDRDVKKGASASKAALASTYSSDAKHLESSQGRGSKTVNVQCGRNVLRDQQTGGLGECATNLASNEQGSEVTRRNDVSSDEMSKGGNKKYHVPARSDNSSKELNGSLRQPVKEEVPRDALQSCGDAGGGSGNAESVSHDKSPMAVNVKIASPDAKESRPCQSSDIDLANSRPNKKLKGELDADDLRHHHVEPLHLNNAKLDTMKVTTQYPDSSVNVLSEERKVIETSAISSEASNPKVLVGSSRTDKSNDPCQYKLQPTGEGPTGARKKSSALKYSSAVADELHKSNGTDRSHPTASYQRKAVSMVKSTSTSGGSISKPSESRQNGLSESTMAFMKDNASADKIEHEEKCGRPKKSAKEYSRHLSKIPESTELSYTSDSKKPSSDSKGTIHSSSKIPLVPNVAFNRVSGECSTSPQQIETDSNVRNKAEPGKVEKLSQSGIHPSARGNVASVTAPTSANVPATLSDEELALLLHQELNSSPRVPRVPRMRHAGSLPQLTGPSATSVLIKRTSSGGGKDHIVTSSRRRTKDFSGEGSHASVEVDNGAKKMEKKPTSPNGRRRDSGYGADPLSRREADGGRAKSVQSMKKTNMGSSVSSSPDASGHNLSCNRPSSRPVSDDDPRMVGRLTNRTLPGLIAEIMREGKRITYEELCNSVLPHWPHLRKHNGERYAYSSHSQAVLDCLRNRSEWARLVDRGSKSTSIRKRRKSDADSVSIESEDNEDNRVKNAKDSGSKSFESRHEDFPKGKRKARKRRCLALQGRGIVRRRRRAEVVSDDESESFSTSSEENSSPSEEEGGGGGEEEEIQGGRASVGGSEASASSDEVS